MWERFLIMECVPYLFCFLTSSLAKGLGMGIEGMGLYGTYTMSVYFTPVIGDSWRIVIGYRWAVVRCFGNDFGSRIDGSETPLFLYIGMGFLLLGMVCLNLI
jgi:POT family proton-dependent oligopeptide transporter